MGSLRSSECPRCRTELVPVSTGSVVLRACEKCLGIWADAGSFQRICVSKQPTELPAGASPLRRRHGQNEPVRYWPCPACGDLMNRVNFADTSGIILDVCRAHGVWLEHEELEQVRQFIQRGGAGRARHPSPPVVRNVESWPTPCPPIAFGPGEVADLIVLVTDVLRLLH